MQVNMSHEHGSVNQSASRLLVSARKSSLIYDFIPACFSVLQCEDLPSLIHFCFCFFTQLWYLFVGVPGLGYSYLPAYGPARGPLDGPVRPSYKTTRREQDPCEDPRPREVDDAKSSQGAAPRAGLPRSGDHYASTHLMRLVMT